MSEFKAKVSEPGQAAHAPPVLADCHVPASRFLDVATCGPSFVTEFRGESAPLPIDGDRYTTVDVLISFIAVMSMRYGLNREAVGKAIRFVKRHNLEQLNAELRAGRTFLFVPTNNKPRFVSHDLDFNELRELCGGGLRERCGGPHGYPGLLLDMATFVESVNDTLESPRPD